MSEDTPSPLLVTALQAAVPLWIHSLRDRPWEYISTRAKECGQHIAEHWDDILYRSKKKGKSAEAFNRLAEGLACLAFSPGGVTFAGLHFEAHRAGE